MVPLIVLLLVLLLLVRPTVQLIVDSVHPVEKHFCI